MVLQQKGGSKPHRLSGLYLLAMLAVWRKLFCLAGDGFTIVTLRTDDGTYLYSKRGRRCRAHCEELTNQGNLMVRTTLSFCVLFGFLIAGFAVLKRPSQKSRPTG